jgi:hypothetical protein
MTLLELMRSIYTLQDRAKEKLAELDAATQALKTVLYSENQPQEINDKSVIREAEAICARGLALGNRPFDNIVPLLRRVYIARSSYDHTASAYSAAIDALRKELLRREIKDAGAMITRELIVEAEHLLCMEKITPTITDTTA